MQTKAKIYIAEKFAIEAKALMLSSPSIEMTDTLSEAQGLIIRSRTKIDSQYLDQIKNLRVIVTSTSGFDHIDLIETQRRGIQVMYTPDANGTAAAEMTWALILSLVRHIHDGHRAVRSGDFSRDKLNGFELEGRTLGIVGLGRIGQKVLKIARGFSMNVAVFDPYQADDVFKTLATPRMSYEEVLKTSDILTFHVPLTKETRNMFNFNHTEYTAPELLLVNAARGGIVNELDLVTMLEQNKLAGAALDVFEKEPLPRDSKLLKAPRLLLSPHTGALTTDAFIKSSTEAAQRIIDFFNLNALRNTLPLVNNWGSLSFKD